MYDFGLTEEQKLLRHNVGSLPSTRSRPWRRFSTRRKAFRPTSRGRWRTWASSASWCRRNTAGRTWTISRTASRWRSIPGWTVRTGDGRGGHSLGIGPIYYFGSEEQKREWLPKLCRGDILASFGLTEPEAGSDAGASRTNARLENGEWVINGSKIFITNSTSVMAGVCTVQAITGTRPDGKKEVSCSWCPTARRGSRRRR